MFCSKAERVFLYASSNNPLITVESCMTVLVIHLYTDINLLLDKIMRRKEDLKYKLYLTHMHIQTYTLAGCQDLADERRQNVVK